MRKALIVILVFVVLFALALAVAASVSAAPDEARNARTVCAWVKQPCPYPGCDARWVRMCKNVKDERYQDM